MLWTWVAVGAAVWVLAALVVGVVLSRMVRLRDHLERPRARSRDAAERDEAHRDTAHRAS